jgi:hypothetical protein
MSEDRLVIDFDSDDDLEAQINILPNDRLLALQEAVSEVVNMRRECGEIE